MNMNAVEKIANAVLYEGYVLYPYRPSAVKNRQRFNFGVAYPFEYCDLQDRSEAWEMQTECLLTGNATTIEAKVRFLQMADRDGWQEGIERDVSTLPFGIEALLDRPMGQPFAFEPATDAEGRRLERLEGELVLGASRIDDSVCKLSLRVRNLSRLESPRETNRDEALLRAFVSAHCILSAEGGTFLSAIDPPPQYRAASQECRNIGLFPVLAGAESQTNLILSSPIILYDYPQIAPESAGDLCDGTEIDEILALRILTMTDAEKREARNGDDRARRILERTELLPPEHFEKLHGALRHMRASDETLHSGVFGGCPGTEVTQ